jgi:3-deoxy-manno-octulosonate cytidylyltransferase (CMP-KDO synthetase)
MAALPSRVLVATDDERIRAALPSDCEVVMTRADHPSGSERIAEVAEKLDCGIIVNVQGDLPLLDPSLVDELVEMLRSDPAMGLTTVAVPIESAEEFENPSVVKVVCGATGHALYLSRAPPRKTRLPGGFQLP